MTHDEKALATIRTHGYAQYDGPTEGVVKVALAPYLDRHPDGTSIIKSGPLDKWDGMVSETGLHVYCPTAYQIMQDATDPKDLTDSEVVFLVMTSDCGDMYTKADWQGVVDQQIERAKRGKRTA